MQSKVGLMLIAAWAVGQMGAYDVGSISHILLLAGLMLLLLSVLNALDGARRRDPRS